MTCAWVLGGKVDDRIINALRHPTMSMSRARAVSPQVSIPRPTVDDRAHKSYEYRNLSVWLKALVGPCPVGVKALKTVDGDGKGPTPSHCRVRRVWLYHDGGLAASCSVVRIYSILATKTTVNILVLYCKCNFYKCKLVMWRYYVCDFK